jgi:Glycosyl hydrolase family 79 C-terminal beta domain
MVFLPRRAVLLVGTLLVGIALVVVALAHYAGGDSTGASGSGGPAAPATPITVLTAARGPVVPRGFVGLSLEYPSIEAYAGTDPTALDPVFEQLVRNLNPGQAPVLRIGGDSTDRTWWPAAGLARPPGVTFAIDNRWLEVTRALARALGARLVVGLNLEAGSPRLAASEAGALIAGVGPGAIRAFELGNEPDLYASFTWYRTPGGHGVTGRPASYDMSALIGDFTRFAASLPPRVLAGPSLGAPPWMSQLGRFLANEPRVRLVTLHRYPLQLCFTPRGSPRHPTVGHLLAPAASLGLAGSFVPFAAIARAHGLPLRIDELNTVSCGADPAVSQTFASALWALDTLFAMVRAGVHGVNIHTFPGAGYELFRLRRMGGRWQATVAPEYYGLMMFARAAPAGSRVLRVDRPVSGSVDTWATRSTDGKVRILVVNTGRRARALSLAVPGEPSARALLERLTAPGVRSRSGVTLAGQSFAPRTYTGLLSGPVRTVTVTPANGRYVIDVPGASAAMLVLAPRGAGSS